MESRAVTATPREEAGDAATLRCRLLDAAEAAFVAQGFHATTMDMIAREARCSKKTVYKLFESKEALFGALMLRLRFEVAALPVDPDLEPSHALREFLLGMADILLRDRSVALIRIATAEAGRLAGRSPPPDGGGTSPPLGMEDYLARLEQAGGHDFGPPGEAVRMLVGMALGAFHHELLTGLEAEVPEAELRRRIDRAVGIFLRGTRRE
ncbi:TetR/AcrR family transcriptional regulator [Roseomonas sp. NAR14]|uniref:TetR/AcrR family transcriptional regulator n=1 Tax=Roseomonas acroporae TaxID=2937791 RepID=A0A9X1Y4U9_9PROT|nr:TetR/AcrR family transcriptional regulator [Roseomonas acroporae]MCK8783308.1 TetR/AcrR family transcriptional regulator [Roseomonas acroporae]